MTSEQTKGTEKRTADSQRVAARICRGEAFGVRSQIWSPKTDLPTSGDVLFMRASG